MHHILSRTTCKTFHFHLVSCQLPFCVFQTAWTPEISRSGQKERAGLPVASFPLFSCIFSKFHFESNCHPRVKASDSVFYMFNWCLYLYFSLCWMSSVWLRFILRGRKWYLLKSLPFVEFLLTFSALKGQEKG